MNRIDALAIGTPGAALTFDRRLARANRWSAAYAARVIAEYRRFVFLAMEAGHPVTPSEDVDQAWHLHLVYTRSYWGDLCEGVLKRPLHHTPTEGGGVENRKFENWYSRTLASYERMFGAPPPRDIWPVVADRFAHAGDARWVDPAQFWIVPKAIARNAVLGGATACGLAATGCTLAMSKPVSGVLTSVVVIVLIIVVLSLITGLCRLFTARSSATRPKSARDDSDGGVVVSAMLFGNSGSASTGKETSRDHRAGGGEDGGGSSGGSGGNKDAGDSGGGGEGGGDGGGDGGGGGGGGCGGGGCGGS